jgi:type II secretory pathway pseudopilin PulG
MPPGEIALLVIIVLSLIGGATVVTQRRSLKRDDEQQRLGAANAKQLQAASARICLECNKAVDATKGDVFDKGTWWCQACYRRLVSVDTTDS